MKVSLNLAQAFSNVDLKSVPREELLKRIGAQLGAVEDVVDWAPKFEGAVIVRIVSCEKHPDADKLHVCRVDDGGQNQQVERDQDGLIQVVCGAPNVHADMFAVWLAPGVVVPKSRETDPFVLEAREIRGIVSNGMMASASELGISEDHSGIVEVTTEDAGKEPVAGSPLIEYFGLDDYVVDCENKMFTHRPDCFGNLGVAREFAGILGQKFKSPDWYLKDVSDGTGRDKSHDLHLQIQNDLPDKVPRFMAVAMRNTSVRPSPLWLQALLTRVGIKPVNNIVDVTNYVMHLTGQPLHAFDYDKIKERSATPGIHPRMSNAGEKLQLLGGKEIELTGDEIVIATDRQAVALAGVMGGSNTEVDENTKNIIIECATFDMYSIRRTSMRHGLFTDAVTRFNKGQSPLQNKAVLAFAARHMSELAGAETASEMYDVFPNASTMRSVRVPLAYINSRLGTTLSEQEIVTLLENVEFQVVPDGEDLQITSPFWRMDIEQPEDVVEEVGRLYGYDKLPVELPKRTIRPVAKNTNFDHSLQLRSILNAAGANEVLTYSFMHGDLLKKAGIDASTWTYHLRNAISPDLQYYRPSLIPSLLAKVHPNIKTQAGRDDNQFALYEIGRAHVKGQEIDNLPEQMERIALVVAADDKTAKSQQSGTAYYLAKKYLDHLTYGQAELVPVEDFDHPVTAPFARGRSAVVKLEGEAIGVIGEFSQLVHKGLKLPAFCAGFELDKEALQKLVQPSVYEPLPPYPGTSQDYTHEVGANESWQSVYEALEQALQSGDPHGYRVRIEPIDIFKAPDADTKRLTFRIHLHHPSKTMTTEEATHFVEQAAARLASPGVEAA